METILVTGGAGFVGSSLALLLRAERPAARVVCLDNLKRRGSELNLPRLKQAGIAFVHGDIRLPGDIEAAGPFDLMVECSAEPSALAGFGGSPDYLLATNLTGTTHCLEACRRHRAALVFLSTSRVYPWQPIRDLAYDRTATRLTLAPDQATPGVSPAGIAETFPLAGPRTLYGATKLASELLITEYAAMYGLSAVVNRCGVLAGSWQMGKVDQGFMVLWLANHLFGKPLSYLGFGGWGGQVRDVLHVRDLFALLRRQLADLPAHAGKVYNVGGGPENTLSLMELTALAREATGQAIPLGGEEATRPGDIPWYVSDIRAVAAATGWSPRVTPGEIILEIADWLKKNADQLRHVL
jgi:CDP-paratose 2-epimerase